MAQSSLGWSLEGLALLLLALQMWNVWELQQLPSSLMSAEKTVDLETALEARLLGKVKPGMELPELWAAVTSCWEGVFIINRLGIPSDVAKQLLPQTPANVIWEESVKLAQGMRLPEVDSGVVVGAILLASKELKPMLSHLKLGEDDVRAVIEWQQRVKQAIAGLNQKPAFGGIGRDWASGYTPTLNRYAQNLSRQIELGSYHHLPQIHESLVEQLEGQLAGGRASVALLGEVGSGKTSLIYSLAERLLKGQAPPSLQYYYVMQLNASVLISSGARVEDIVLQLLSEAVHAKNVIIFLDEAQLFLNSGTGSVDLSQILLPILQQSSLKLIMAMTPQDWQTLSARNPALSTAVQRLTVPKPSQMDTMKVMEDAAIGIEHQSSTIMSYQALNEAYRLADRYMTETAFPGKGITLLEAAARNAEGGLVTPTSVQLAVEAMVGTKVATASAVESRQLLNLEDQIHQRMINQTRAVKVVSDALRRARAGVRNPKRPVGSFLFLGPTGVGKTELARALADIYFGGQDRIVRVDMSEYQQPSDIDRLLASAPGGRAGSTLISGVRKQPFSVVLFDEIEKAHPDVLNLLLQLLDEGRLTDTDGRVASFKDAIVIATSNAAADTIRAKIGAGERLEAFEEEITRGLIDNHQFKPELINRFDEIVLFRPLTKPELQQVVSLLVAEVNTTLEPQKISVGLTQAAINWLVETGYDPQLGARPMRRMVQKTVENIVAAKILAGEVQPGQQLKLDVGDLQPAA
jgi:ATP-dependent Clp protease ATP-binding subunit ClpC